MKAATPTFGSGIADSGRARPNGMKSVPFDEYEAVRNVPSLLIRSQTVFGKLASSSGVRSAAPPSIGVPSCWRMNSRLRPSGTLMNDSFAKSWSEP